MRRTTVLRSHTRDFAEALSLDPKSAAARQGLAEARGPR
jgi:hypothetical protein